MSVVSIPRALVVMRNDDVSHEFVLSLTGHLLALACSIEQGWRVFDPFSMSCAFIEYDMPDGCGLDLQRWIQERAPWVRTLVLARGDDVLPPWAKVQDGVVEVEPNVDPSYFRPPPPFEPFVRLRDDELVRQSLGMTQAEFDWLPVAVLPWSASGGSDPIAPDTLAGASGIPRGTTCTLSGHRAIFALRC